VIKLIAIGKNKDKALQSLEKEYMKRLSAFCKFSEIEVKDEANEHVSREAEVLLVKEKEGNRVLEKISDQDFVVLLDLHGKKYIQSGFLLRHKRICLCKLEYESYVEKS
jgi:23S rRNA (pseudouridine1915-N3)-methyltransferase